MSSTLSDPSSFENRYKKICYLGEGTYGVVYKAYDQVQKQFVAIKQMRIDGQEDEGIPATTLRQISILKRLDHPNIVQLREVYCSRSETKISLVFDYHEGDLRQYIKSLPPNVSIQFLRDQFSQLLAGVDHCHSLGIMHRDLQPQNILVTSSGTLQIADFGLARAFNFAKKELTKESVTLWYRSPELIFAQEYYDISVDMWSVGCILAEFVTRQPLFMGNSQIDQLFKIFQYSGTPDYSTWPKLSQYQDFQNTFPKFKPNNLFEQERFGILGQSGIQMLSQLLEINPDNRINSRECAQSPFFNNSKDLLL